MFGAKYFNKEDQEKTRQREEKLKKRISAKFS